MMISIKDEFVRLSEFTNVISDENDELLASTYGLKKTYETVNHSTTQLKWLKMCQYSCHVIRQQLTEFAKMHNSDYNKLNGHTKLFGLNV